MKKILFLINTLDGGGAEHVLVELANGLAEKGYDVTVQTVIDGGVFGDRLNNNVHRKSILKLHGSFFTKILIYLVCFILSPSLVYRKWVFGDYDYEVAFLEGVPTKIISASTNEKAKKYAWVHIDLYNTYGLEKVYNNLEEHIASYRKFDKIICVSDNVKTAFVKKFGLSENLEVKYNPVDEKRIKTQALEEIKRSQRFRIVSVGRLEKQKGFDRLLMIMKRLNNEHIDCELVIVGEGSRRAEYEGYIKYNSLADRVTLTGFVDNPYKYMKSADLIVFPSRAEGYSTVATEALIIEAPIVVSDCAGMKELFGESEYGVVTENNEQALYNAIKRMILDDEYRMHYTNMAKVRAKDFSKEARVADIEKLFKL